jgi:hypothetical protein
MFDALYPPGLQWYWKGDFFERVDDAAVALHLKCSERMPTMLSAMHLYPVDGAAARVGERDSAWGYRRARFSEVIIGVDPAPANADMVRSWARTTGWHSIPVVGWRVQQLHDGRRGHRTGAGNLWRQLREAARSEAEVRSGERFPRESEYRSASVRGAPELPGPTPAAALAAELVSSSRSQDLSNARFNAGPNA